MKKFLIIFRNSLSDTSWNKIMHYHQWEGLYNLGFRLADILPVRSCDYFVSYHANNEKIHQFIYALSEKTDVAIAFKAYDIYDHDLILNDLQTEFAKRHSII